MTTVSPLAATPWIAPFLSTLTLFSWQSISPEVLLGSVLMPAIALVLPRPRLVFVVPPPPGLLPPVPPGIVAVPFVGAKLFT